MPVRCNGLLGGPSVPLLTLRRKAPQTWLPARTRCAGRSGQPRARGLRCIRRALAPRPTSPRWRCRTTGAPELAPLGAAEGALKAERQSDSGRDSGLNQAELLPFEAPAAEPRHTPALRSGDRHTNTPLPDRSSPPPEAPPHIGPRPPLERGPVPRARVRPCPLGAPQGDLHKPTPSSLFLIARPTPAFSGEARRAGRRPGRRVSSV